MKRLSSLVTHFLVSALALTAAGVSAAVDGAISVVSSDPNVLLVTPQEDGKFHVAVVGTGFATLKVFADADLGDGVRTITQEFSYEVYDGTSEADHFDLVIEHIARSDDASAVAEASESVTTEDNSTAS